MQSDPIIRESPQKDNQTSESLRPWRMITDSLRTRILVPETGRTAVGSSCGGGSKEWRNCQIRDRPYPRNALRHESSGSTRASGIRSSSGRGRHDLFGVVTTCRFVFRRGFVLSRFHRAGGRGATATDRETTQGCHHQKTREELFHRSHLSTCILKKMYSAGPRGTCLHQQVDP